MLLILTCEQLTTSNCLGWQVVSTCESCCTLVGGCVWLCLWSWGGEGHFLRGVGELLCVFGGGAWREGGREGGEEGGASVETGRGDIPMVGQLAQFLLFHVHMPAAKLQQQGHGTAS